VAAQKAKVPVLILDTSQASLDKGLKFAGKRLIEASAVLTGHRQASGKGCGKRADIKG
jgi:3-hydroxybutyryl-CoA dehydrogenase